MSISYNFKVLGAVAVLGALISVEGIAGTDTFIKVDGSSTMYPITEEGAKKFQATKKEVVKVSVGISGTGGGFTKFCRGEIDIVNASRPIQRAEMKSCDKAGVEFVELPMAFDALTVVVNPNNTWSKTMTVAELKKIWEPAAQGKITKWSQVNPAWPDEKFNLYAPGPHSGTLDYFTQAIVGKAKSSRGDFTVSEDKSILMQNLAKDKNALGFFGFGFYMENQDKINAVAVDDGRNGGVIPSAETVEDGTYQPLSRPIFIYVNIKGAEKTELKEFIAFYMKNASSLVRGFQYFPLPPRAYAANMEILKTKRVGTVFDGFVPGGLTIDDLLRRESTRHEN